MGAMLLSVYDVQAMCFLGDWEWEWRGGYVIRLMGRQGQPGNAWDKMS
jgi:hypothetical protein